MRIAVVGAGYAGLAVVWNLLEKNCDVTVFDEGKGASSVSTGLLHRAPGKKATPCLQSEEGMKASLELLQATSREGPIFEQSGILRFAINEEQKELFGGPTLWMPEGVTVYSRKYLEALKKLCQKAKWIQGRVEDLSELREFDAIVLATGAETLQWFDLPLKCTIGQSLLCRWPERLPHSLLAQGHISPTENPEFCCVGSTYEHTPQPDPKKALALLDKVALFYPPAKDFKVEAIQSGTRISPKVGYIPLTEKVGPKTWVFSGLGSRGLLYHALFAKLLVSNILIDL